jgi:hypothetical protein
MSEFTKVEKNIYKMKDGSIWEGVPADLPRSGASLIAKAGKEYPTEWLKEQGWGKKAPAKKKKAEPKKSSKKKVETKAVKPSEDK